MSVTQKGKEKLITVVKIRIYNWSKTLGNKIGLDLPYFIKNGFWVIVRQVVGTISGLVLSVIFARMVTREVFGEYQFVLSVLAIISILSIPGLNISLIRSVARGYEGDYKKVVKVSFKWSLLGVPVLLMVGSYYYLHQHQLLGIALMISSLFFPFLYAPNTWDSFLQGKGRFDISAKYGSFQVLINAITIAGVILFCHSSLILIIIAYFVSYTLCNVYYFVQSWQYIKNNKKDRQVVRYGKFLTLISVLSVIAGNVDKLIIGTFFSVGHLAVYSIGILILKQLQIVAKGLLWITVPKQIKQGDISIGNYLKLFILAIIISIIIWFITPTIITVLYSEKYNEASHFARIAVVFFPFFIMSVIYRNHFLYNKDEKVIAIESIVTPLIKMIIMIIFIPIFGIPFLAFLFGFQYFISIFVLFSVYNIKKIKYAKAIQ